MKFAFLAGIALALSSSAALAGNVAYIEQIGNTALTEATQKKGTDNDLHVYQAGNHKLYSTQSGSDNKATVYQNTAYLPGFDSNNVVDLSQTGNGNGFKSRQEGVNNTIVTTQVSTKSQGNNAEINQFGYTNYADVNQTGARGKLTLTQNYLNGYVLYNDSGSDNWSDVTQDGDNNQLTATLKGKVQDLFVNQFGNDNVTVFYGEGSGNYANIYQNGDRNLTDVSQTGASATADTLQVGNDNNIVLRQQ